LNQALLQQLCVVYATVVIGFGSGGSVAKKGCFLGFEWDKPNRTTVSAPLQKHLQKSTISPLEKILPTPMNAA